MFLVDGPIFTVDVWCVAGGDVLECPLKATFPFVNISEVGWEEDGKYLVVRLKDDIRVIAPSDGKRLIEAWKKWLNKS